MLSDTGGEEYESAEALYAIFHIVGDIIEIRLTR